MIHIPEIYKDIRLEEYAPEFAEQKITVRINPTRAILAEMAVMRKELENKLEKEDLLRFAGLIAKLWRGWTEKEVFELFEQSYETDPTLFEWLIYRTMTMIVEHRLRVKKK